MDFYVILVDGKYAGEFRFSHARELWAALQSQGLAPEGEFPPFPSRFFNKRERRAGLERWLVATMADPAVVRSPEFRFFAKERRRWDEAVPVMMSPLIVRKPGTV